MMKKEIIFIQLNGVYTLKTKGQENEP